MTHPVATTPGPMRRLQPAGALLLRRPLLLPLGGFLSLATFLAWVGAAAHYSRLPAPRTDAQFVALVAAELALVLPAAWIALLGDGVLQARRRPVVRLAPGWRAATSASLLAWVATLTLACGAVGALVPGWHVASGAGLALAGCGTGALLAFTPRVPARWLAAPALAVLAPAAGGVAAHVLGAGLLAALGAALCALALGPLRVRLEREERDPGATLLMALAKPDDMKQLQRRATRRDPGAAPDLDGTLVGWWHAHRFEQRSAQGIGTWRGALGFAVVICALASFAPVFAAWGDATPGVSLLGRVLSNARDGLLLAPGAPERAALGTDMLTTMLLLACAVPMVAAGAPLLGGFLYPIERRMLARLAGCASLANLGRAFVALALVLSVASLGLAAVTEDGPPAGFPGWVASLALGAALAPWAQIAALALSRTARSRSVARAAWWGVPLTLLTLVLGPKGFGLALRTWPLLEHLGAWACGYALALAVTLAVWWAFLGWHYRTTDLAG